MKRIVKVFLSCMLSVSLFGCQSTEMKEAKDAYNQEVARIKSEEQELNTTISDASTYLDNAGTPLYQSKKSDLKKSIKSGKEAIKEIPNAPKDEKEIYKLIDDELKGYSYTDEITTIKKDKKELEDSVKQFKQLSNPKEEFIIERLKELETIDEIAPATEDNDPNGNLNKQGGYTSQIYFSTPTLVDQSQFDGDVIEKGTDSGGSIEIYRTVKDAKRREEYLSNFDGGAFASGSHTVVGTVLVRTSDKLTASQQNELEKQIIEVISRLD